MDYSRSTSTSRRLDGAYAFVVSAALIITAGLNRSHPEVFHRFMGSINPLPVFLMAGILGQVCLSTLARKYDLKIKTRMHFNNLLPVILGTIVFGSIMILVDYSFPLPADVNIRLPVSLLFYPGIGLLVEFLCLSLRVPSLL
jgi:hypothetical protein